MSCIACFDSVLKSNSIDCADPFCTTRLCSDCFKTNLNICLEDGIVPSCPNCKVKYILKDMRKLLSATDLEKYYKTCFIEFEKTKGDEAKKDITKEKMLEKIRKERNLFIQREFPAAISKVANVALQSKINRLQKKTREKVSAEQNKAHKRCFNLICFGQLDKNYKCNYCDTVFCKDCEEEKTEKHKCNKELVENINFLKQQIACPKCKTPVEKADGCNSITCSICRTNFDYSTGEQGGHGSHNLEIVLRTTYSLRTEYEDFIKDNEIRDLVAQFDFLAHKNVLDNYEQAIQKILKKHYLASKSILETGKQIAIKLNEYKKQSYYDKLYIRCSKSIIQLLKSNTVTPQRLEKIIKRLENYMNNNEKEENEEENGKEEE